MFKVMSLVDKNGNRSFIELGWKVNLSHDLRKLSLKSDDVSIVLGCQNTTFTSYDDAKSWVLRVFEALNSVFKNGESWSRQLMKIITSNSEKRTVVLSINKKYESKILTFNFKKNGDDFDVQCKIKTQSTFKIGQVKRPFNGLSEAVNRDRGAVSEAGQASMPLKRSRVIVMCDSDDSSSEDSTGPVDVPNDPFNDGSLGNLDREQIESVISKDAQFSGLDEADYRRLLADQARNSSPENRRLKKRRASFEIYNDSRGNMLSTTTKGDECEIKSGKYF